MVSQRAFRYTSALVLLLGLLLAGCEGGTSKPAFQLTDITGAEFGRNFTLTDHNGRVRTLDDFKGKVVAVFFGYIFCPDVCPTTMGEMALVMKELGADAERVQVLFITFLGLYGDEEATKRTAKDFRIFYQKQPMSGGGYTMDHTAGTYIYDKAGRLRLFFPYGQGAQKLLHDIRLLLQ